MSGTSDCWAVSQHGYPVTAIFPNVAVTVIAGPGRDFICTQHPDHRGDHKACDGHGHIVATWPRRRPERYWRPGDRDAHGHERART